jgi:sulfur-carrier protein
MSTRFRGSSAPNLVRVEASPVPIVLFTPALQRFLHAPQAHVAGATVGEALGAAFAEHPALRGYVLDDQGAVRRHVNIYVDGEPVRDRVRLSDPVGPECRIYVLQALTGG